MKTFDTLSTRRSGALVAFDEENPPLVVIRCAVILNSCFRTFRHSPDSVHENGAAGEEPPVTGPPFYVERQSVFHCRPVVTHILQHRKNRKHGKCFLLPPSCVGSWMPTIGELWIVYFVSKETTASNSIRNGHDVAEKSSCRGLKSASWAVLPSGTEFLGSLLSAWESSVQIMRALGPVTPKEE
jgi:hypothetical protein